MKFCLWLKNERILEKYPKMLPCEWTQAYPTVSVVEILYAVYDFMRHDPQNPN
jgi:hypothetical protein